MSTAIDCSFGIAEETGGYGTGVTVTRFFEVAETFSKDLGIEDGNSIRVGKRVKRLDRNVVTQTEVAGDITMDSITRGMGLLFNAFFGSITNTVVPSSSPAVYQQVHTPSVSDVMKSFTIQKGIPPVGGGSTIPITLTGMMADTLDITMKSKGVLETKLGWKGKDASRDVSYAAPSYAVDKGLFTNVHSRIGLGGTLVSPTSTAVASGTTAADNVADVSLSFKNNLDDDGYNLNGRGKRSRKNMLGMLDISGKITAEFDSTALLDAYWAQTPMPLTVDFIHDVEIEPTLHIFSQLQIVIPSIRLKGETPKSNGGKPISQSIDFEGFDNGVAAQQVYLVYRTLDTTP